MPICICRRSLHVLRFFFAAIQGRTHIFIYIVFIYLFVSGIRFCFSMFFIYIVLILQHSIGIRFMDVGWVMCASVTTLVVGFWRQNDAISATRWLPGYPLFAWKDGKSKQPVDICQPHSDNKTGQSLFGHVVRTAAKVVAHCAERCHLLDRLASSFRQATDPRVQMNYGSLASMESVVYFISIFTDVCWLFIATVLLSQILCLIQRNSRIFIRLTY